MLKAVKGSESYIQIYINRELGNLLDLTQDSCNLLEPYVHGALVIYRRLELK